MSTERADPTRIVADADVLVSALFADGAAREALDVLRAHSWLTLVASEPLLADTEAMIADLADADLAADVRARIAADVDLVEHPGGDHPALASALAGRAAHVLSFDEALQSAEAAASIRARVETSVKSPDGFVRLFDAESLYEATHDDAYTGPDRDPRA